MIIRMAHVTDLAAIQNCARAAYSHYVARIGRAPAAMVADFASQIARGQIHVVEQDERVRGFIVLYERGDHLHVENVAVEPDHQGSGLGRALLAFAEDQARAGKLRAIELHTNEQMIENIAFYPRLGYVETGRGEEEGLPRVYFRKEL